MVYIHFPSNLTEEEIMLQAKYQKLKKKVNLIEKKIKCLILNFFLPLEKGSPSIKSTKTRAGKTNFTKTSS